MFFLYRPSLVETKNRPTGIGKSNEKNRNRKWWAVQKRYRNEENVLIGL